MLSMTAPERPASIATTNTAGCVRATSPVLAMPLTPFPIGPGPTPTGPHARNALTAASAAVTGMMARRARFHRARGAASAIPPTSWTLTVSFFPAVEHSYESHHTGERVTAQAW